MRHDGAVTRTFTRMALRWRRFAEGDVMYAFRHSPTAICSFILIVILTLAAFFAPWIAVQNPFDLASIDIAEAHLPPVWCGGEVSRFLGTDDQGRDLFSTMLYGMRLSLMISVASVSLSIVIGVSLGLLSGFVGGIVDALIMRICDVMLSFPAILVALLVDGILRAALASSTHEGMAYSVLIFAIALSGWVQYARTVRGLTLMEKQKEYVLSARVIGVRRFPLVFGHILPNVLSPVFVLATVHIATAIMTEATLSFLGVGVPPTTPSLGTLIRIGNDYLFSGEWWVTLFPGAALVLLVLAVNLFGDWMRDALNPKL